MIDRRIHAIQIAEAHKNSDLDIKFDAENEHRIFTPARVHIPVRLVKYDNQTPTPEPAEEVICPKCTML